VIRFKKPGRIYQRKSAPSAGNFALPQRLNCLILLHMGHSINIVACNVFCSQSGLQRGRIDGKTTLFFLSTPKAFDPFAPAPVF